MAPNGAANRDRDVPPPPIPSARTPSLPRGGPALRPTARGLRARAKSQRLAGRGAEPPRVPMRPRAARPKVRPPRGARPRVEPPRGARPSAAVPRAGLATTPPKTVRPRRAAHPRATHLRTTQPRAAQPRRTSLAAALDITAHRHTSGERTPQRAEPPAKGAPHRLAVPATQPVTERVAGTRHLPPKRPGGPEVRRVAELLPQPTQPPRAAQSAPPPPISVRGRGHDSAHRRARKLAPRMGALGPAGPQDLPKPPEPGAPVRPAPLLRSLHRRTLLRLLPQPALPGREVGHRRRDRRGYLLRRRPLRQRGPLPLGPLTTGQLPPGRARGPRPPGRTGGGYQSPRPKTPTGSSARRPDISSFPNGPPSRGCSIAASTP
jgi:hypothetical protein